MEPRRHGGLAKTIDNLVRDRDLLEGMLDEFEQNHAPNWMMKFTLILVTGSSSFMPRLLLYRYCLRWDLGFSYEECGHVLMGRFGPINFWPPEDFSQRPHRLIFGSEKELDPNTYTIHGPEDLSNLPFVLTLRPTPRAQIVG